MTDAINLINTIEKLNTTFNRIETGTHCGLDIEMTLLDNRVRLSTIQLAFAENVICIHFKYVQVEDVWVSPFLEKVKLNGGAFATFMSNPLNTKSGVGIVDDCKKIFNELSIVTNGVIELQYIANAMGISERSLEDLCYRYIPEYEGKPSCKGGFNDLPQDKLNYILHDAVASFLLFYMMFNKPIPSVKTVVDTQDYNNDIEYIKKYLEAMKHKQSVAIPKILNHMLNSNSIWKKCLTRDEATKRLPAILQSMAKESIITIKGDEVSLRN